jgi:hypothetical protein
LVGLGGRVVPGGDAVPLFQLGEAPFHHVAPLVGVAVEGRGPSATAAAVQPVADLVGSLGNGVADPAPTQRCGSPWSCSPCRPGRARAAPGAVTAMNRVRSLVLAPVTVKASGRPAPSQAR